TGEVALRCGAIVVMGMAANPRGAHQAGELSRAGLIGRKCWSAASTSGSVRVAERARSKSRLADRRGEEELAYRGRAVVQELHTSGFLMSPLERSSWRRCAKSGSKAEAHGEPVAGYGRNADCCWTATGRAASSTRRGRTAASNS